MENKNPFENALRQMKHAISLAPDLASNPNIFERLSHPKRIIEVHIPVKMDSGKIRTFV
jgi:glutamate dehydrogenase/leucine dehydrogenase